MKKLIFLLSIFGCTGSFFSQEFQRSWGTYYGPAGTDLGNSVYTKIHFDVNNNLNFIGSVVTNSNYSTSYYNQFSSSGTGYAISSLINYLSGIVSTNGSIISNNYVGISTSAEFPNKSFDYFSNRFSTELSTGGFTNVGTTGTWFPNSSAAGSNNFLLSKYNSSGLLQWKTFLPTINFALSSEIEHDESGNTYVSGTTFNQNIGTSGAFQPNFIIRYGPNGEILPNTFIAKLDSSGQLVWATYFPATLYRMRYFNGNIYISGSADADTALTEMDTPNAFQSQKTDISLTKISATNGNRIWGTYYGPVGLSFLLLSSGFDVNETGIYIMGDVYDFAGTGNSYFGTPGSFQTVAQGAVGTSEIFLSKFNHDGGRVWSTYYGSSAEEMSAYSNHPLEVFGNHVYFCGIQQVSSNGGSPANLATPNTHIASPPTYSGSSNLSYNNLFFAKFDSSGTREWSSYYGGAAAQIGSVPGMNIAVFDSDTFYLYGSTASTVGISTEGAAQSTGVSNILNGFLAKFDRKNLSTSETSLIKDLILYDNPNNGIFTIEGDILRKKDFTLHIYDFSGRLLYREKMKKEGKQVFNYQGRLKTGTYSVQIAAGKSLEKNFKMIVK